MKKTKDKEAVDFFNNICNNYLITHNNTDNYFKIQEKIIIYKNNNTVLHIHFRKYEILISYQYDEEKGGHRYISYSDDYQKILFKELDNTLYFRSVNRKHKINKFKNGATI